MTPSWWLGMEMAGGLALFLFGMRTLTSHLQQAAGNFLRRGLRQASRNRLTGMSVGMLLGFTIQSGPASVMLVSLTHAGLLSLMRAAPVVFGFNVGTTLAMQVLAFNVTAVWPVPLALGLLASLTGRNPRTRDAGMALAGFGLLILGLGTMTATLSALREPLTPWLAGIHGDSVPAVLLGVAAGTAVTGLLFSSAASIGMCLALAAAGVFTELRQVYPIILGAQLGTCLTSLLAAVNANSTGRRTALLHVGFNAVNVLLGLALLRWLPGWIERTAPNDLARQIANLHTALRASTALLLVPFSTRMVRLLHRATRRLGPPPELSHLNEDHLPRPEQALVNAVDECRRLSQLCGEGLELTAALPATWDRRAARKISADEAAIDQIKPVFQDYLLRLSKRHLSHRQAILMTSLNRCIISIERIQDHIEHLCALIEGAHEARIVIPNAEDRDRLRQLFELAIRGLEAVTQSFDTRHRKRDFDHMAMKIRTLTDDYERFSDECRAYYTARSWRKGTGMLPAQGLFVDACKHDLEEIMQHVANIAMAESRSEFFIKTSKLPREAPPIQPPLQTPQSP